MEFNSKTYQLFEKFMEDKITLAESKQLTRLLLNDYKKYDECRFRFYLYTYFFEYVGFLATGKRIIEEIRKGSKP